MKNKEMAKFYYFVAETHTASEAVDNFNLESNNEQSKNRFNFLVSEQRKTSNELIDFIVKNSGLLKEQI